MARYTKVLKSLAHNAVGNKRIEAAAPAGQNYYVTGATLGGAPNYTLSLARNGGLGTVDVNLVDLVTAGTSGIAGSITDNQIAVGASTADSIEGSSVLTYDGNKVKLGDSSDTANYFEVQGDDTENTYDVFIGRRRYPRISLNDRGSYTMQIWALGSELRFGTSAGSNTNAAFVVKSGSAAGAYTFGNIGIGTTSPGSKLDIVSTSNDNTGGIRIGDGSTFAAIYHDSSENLIIDPVSDFIVTGSDDVRIQSSDDFELLADDFYFKNDADNSTMMRITSAGNVGIGTDSPSNKLNINTGAGTFDFKDYNLTYTTSLGIRAEGSGYLGLVTEGANDVFISTNGFANKRLVVKSDGKVGIGTTSPSYELTLADKFMWDGNHWRANQTNGASMRNEVPSATNPVFTFNNDVDTGMSRAAADELSLITAGTEAIRVDSSQNVGIGTTTPDDLLHVLGGDVDPSIKLENNRSGHNGYYLMEHRGSTVKLQSSGSSAVPMRFTIQNTEMMRLNDTGLGIGTTSPSRKLHVVEGSNGYAARFEDGIELDGTNVKLLGYGNGNLWVMGNSSNPKLTLGYSHNWDFAVSLRYIRGATNGSSYVGDGEFRLGQTDKNNANYDHGVTSFYVSGSEAMRLTKDKHLGIGTTVPGGTPGAVPTKLYVSGGAATFDNGSSHSVFFKNAGSQYGAIDTYGTSLSIEANNEAILSGAAGVLLKGGNYGVLLSPIGTNAGDTSRLRFRELAANGTATVSVKAPDSIASDIQMILPAAAGTANQVLAIDSVSSGIMTLGFQTNGSIGGSVSSGFIPVASSADTLADGVLFTSGATESMYIGATPGTLNAANYNTTLGYQAGDDITEGDENTLIGQGAGANITTGDANTFIGRATGFNASTANNLVVIGREAGYQLTTGSSNVLIGMRAGYNVTKGAENVMIGQSAGQNYAGTTSGVYGAFSTFIGHAAGYAVTGGHSYGSVMAIGHQPMYNATGAKKSIAIGQSAVVSGTNAEDVVALGNAAGAYADATGSTLIGNKAGFRSSGNYNTVVGYRALSGSSSGDTSHLNTVMGYVAMEDSTSAQENVAIGAYAGGNITTGDYNTAIGYAALRSGAAMSRQVAVGYFALGNYIEASDSRNTGVGMYAMSNIRSGSANVALGYEALKGVNDAANDCHSNTAVGRESLKSITSADNNTALGYQAGQNNTTGDGNVFLGKSAGPSSTNTDSNKLYINNAAGTPLIGGDFSSFQVHMNANVGIGNTNPQAKLHLSAGSSSEPIILLENTNADNTPPGVTFYKNTASPASSDQIGSIKFDSEEATSSDRKTYWEIQARINDPTNTTPNGQLNFYGLDGDSPGFIHQFQFINSQFSVLDGNGIGPTISCSDTNGGTFKTQGQKMRLQAKSDSTGEIHMMANQVGIGTTAPAAGLHISSTETSQLRITSGSNTQCDFKVSQYGGLTLDVNHTLDLDVTRHIDYNVGSSRLHRFYVGGTQTLQHQLESGGGLLDFKGTQGKIWHAATPVAQIKDDTGFIMEDNQGIKNHVATLANFPIDIGTGIATADIQGFSKIQNISLAAYAGGGLPTNLDVKLPVGAAGMEFIVTLGDTALNLGSLTLRLVANGSDVIYNAANAVSNISYTKNVGESIHLICFEANKWSVVAHT